jgi:hypothetical protein
LTEAALKEWKDMECEQRQLYESEAAGVAETNPRHASFLLAMVFFPPANQAHM